MRFLTETSCAILLALLSMQRCAITAQSIRREVLHQRSTTSVYSFAYSPYTIAVKTNEIPDTVPADVECKKVERCDRRNICIMTCERGSVVMNQWAQEALKLQRQLAYGRSICSAQLPGSHNSAITMAEGYGLEDHYFEKYLRYISYVARGLHIHTNNQLFSLTDQLQLGVRLIELDVHWVDNDIRIAHCGGFHSSALDGLVAALNKIAKVFHSEIEWDAETIGCKPSLSSIPADELRTFDDALSEISDWLHASRNANEFLIIFLDDQVNLERWGKVGLLIKYIVNRFSASEIFTPLDIKERTGWPSYKDLMKQGKHIMFMSGIAYTNASDILFAKMDVCNWTEPLLPLLAYPKCDFKRGGSPLNLPETVFRPQTSEIEYAFLNADGYPGHNQEELNETNIPDIARCGVNYASPDNVTPKRLESFIWTFQNGYIRNQSACLGLNKSSAYWQNMKCDDLTETVAACRDHNDIRFWKLSGPVSSTAAAKDACQAFGAKMIFSIPASGYENQLVYEQLSASSSNITHVIYNAESI